MRDNRQICEMLEDVYSSLNAACSRLVWFNVAHTKVFKDRGLIDILTQINNIREDLRKELTHLNRERDNEKEKN